MVMMRRVKLIKYKRFYSEKDSKLILIITLHQYYHLFFILYFITICQYEHSMSSSMLKFKDETIFYHFLQKKQLATLSIKSQHHRKAK